VGLVAIFEQFPGFEISLLSNLIDARPLASTQTVNTPLVILAVLWETYMKITDNEKCEMLKLLQNKKNRGNQ
jgi:hypothetical protein